MQLEQSLEVKTKLDFSPVVMPGYRVCVCVSCSGSVPRRLFTSTKLTPPDTHTECKGLTQRRRIGGRQSAPDIKLDCLLRTEICTTTMPLVVVAGLGRAERRTGPGGLRLSSVPPSSSAGLISPSFAPSSLRVPCLPLLLRPCCPGFSRLLLTPSQSSDTA